mmetsp:Transcript_15018/g.21027  ORF Transcript_15018/g.21027 Transcript_15018/m.21027 type:complete len:177 (+) Transcript_15018:48-578(+)|eukprot:CAMPEP_0201489534 /NCGR_PEP_ID=MMETSP0151_2-20130828/22865_1 /ASSEMBLY_ACC=CAM_ASM_000257 /TAXON_ID=200890 /ORGANISM="Paramoeba atlantica, Strain 621/1 / CCAP 1560/9" /LENGTH=176 /DNA_ID=CAMNT_0047875157 /DNA_START=36 /DNA_END=566 /DNA_ORIENTATION=+
MGAQRSVFKEVKLLKGQTILVGSTGGAHFQYLERLAKNLPDHAVVEKFQDDKGRLTKVVINDATFEAMMLDPDVFSIEQQTEKFKSANGLLFVVGSREEEEKDLEHLRRVSEWELLADLAMVVSCLDTLSEEAVKKIDDVCERNGFVQSRLGSETEGEISWTLNWLSGSILQDSME